ncbi:MAG: acetylxylan esterase [Candidatus Omnitrophica bacterium]|nr:acetylxylan esterase [Candidatus Omnitrophota bacterium]
MGVFRFIALLVVFPAFSIGGSLVNSPLYQHLLNQAVERLDERKAEILSLSGPDAYKARGEKVRASIIEGMGQFPERCPLNARTVWTRDFGDYVVEGVIFNSRPDFPVTANLYLPKQGEPPYPAVLGPCGHALEAKAMEAYQYCWINLARRGFAVLTYDPIGQGERLGYLKEDGAPDFWGTTEHTQLGALALLLGHSFARDEIWDGIRALDYLETRSDIDKTRIGCTGNSGGGTQTAYLMAIDPRIRCAAASCYITSLQRLFETIGPQDAEQNLIGQVARGIDHADFIESQFPNPVLICCASEDFFDIRGTWETFREAKKYFGKFGMPERVDLIESPEEHGYHLPQRTAMYHWMSRWLKGTIDEEPEPETRAQAAKDLNCTETGQVLTSIPEARTLQSIYREEAQRLREKRLSYLSTNSSETWLSDLQKICGITPRASSAWNEKGHAEADGIRESTWTTEIEPGWNLLATLYEKNSGSSQPPILIVADSIGQFESEDDMRNRAREGYPVLRVIPRGLDMQERYKGGELDQYFGDWVVSFLALHLDRPLVGQRAADVLKAADFLAQKFPGQKIDVIANNEATIPALLAAVNDQRIGQIRLIEGLISWDSAFQLPYTRGILSNIAPGILEIADIPDLMAAVSPRKVILQSPVMATGEKAAAEEMEKILAPVREKEKTSGVKVLDILP